ncbi:MAG: NAD(P)/FAD-dependent oxidoreductase [Candidatus Thorarchaeota archaeon]
MDGEHMDNTQFDIIIIGGGPAGLTAAIYAAGLGKTTLLLEGQIYGGRAATAPHVWNYPGFPEGIVGQELINQMVLHAENQNALLKYGTEVIDLQLKGQPKLVITRENTYQAAAVVIATGTQRKKLRLPGETEFIGRGVSYCPICDGPLYRGLQVAVIGSGNEAFEDALHLTNFADQVTLVTHQSRIEAETRFIDEAQQKTNLKIVKGKLLAIIGDQVVTSITYSPFEDKSKHELPLDGVFISVGGVPLTALVKKAGVETNSRGCIIVTRQQATNVEGVYAAGDCTCGGMQIITAAGEGAMAGLQAHRFIKKVNDASKK